jgi:glutathione S-transferase
VRGLSDKVRSSYVGPQVALHLDYLESELGKSRWFAGNAFSVADIQMSYPIEAASMRAGLGSRGRLADWLKRAHERPAYRRALAKGGPLHDFD